MADGDFLVVAIVFGSIVTIVFLGIVGSIIKTAIKRKSGNLSENKEFLAALREFKEKTDRRLSNLEEIVADEKPGRSVSSKKTGEKKPEQKSSIEIEIEHQRESEEQKESGKLRNMLNQ
ncbi:MAG: hypothetical protein EA390_09620 [Balneolaceae bacterium]|nr:MAG: hypothetical protein EA390_09620 [Balneolaceae bacterium]